MGYPFGYVWIAYWIGKDNKLDMLGECVGLTVDIPLDKLDMHMDILLDRRG
jgi:hypothetical protein